MPPKDVFYFSHDANARNDIKIIKLRRQLGLEGYGAYWCLIETLRETANFILPLTSIEDIAYDINIAKEKLEAVVMNYELFVIENQEFYSQRLINSMQLYATQKQRLSEGGKRGMQKRWSKGNNDKGMVL